jgi:catechol 2,3-dioxygenase-like lactoylglutathione lyase family enzyme
MTEARFAYTIVYVSDVARTMSWFERVFGLERKALTDTGDYGELRTGDVTLSFSSVWLGDPDRPPDYLHHDASALPFPYELAFATEDVDGLVQAALDNGASLVSAPVRKPWGQVVAYVRDPNGILIEICTPMQG